MQIKSISLHPKHAPVATLTAYLPDLVVAKPRQAVIICPGGGYAMVSPREGEPVALTFVAQGMAAFVLDYAVAPIRYPAALRQLAEAMTIVRAHAGAWQLTEIFVAGFSAGGHLAASLGTQYQQPVLEDYDPVVIRPDGMMLAYPVITSGKFAHRESFTNLLGDQDSQSQSLESLVTTQTPPTFIWTTADDQTVPAMNSLLFVEALQQAGVEVEFHLFPHGRHGMSLGTAWVNADDGVAHATSWPQLFLDWLSVTFG
ncbi:alpha/beta hydrolase [Lacticaseibacillus porcinae]|uniref:alpha/beta hydrolase n=1 Tax=Lacticaseibacillus porcinae TaxID=1123687 RepID=UPI000F787BEA|nr:alpha/beta hydrolase [Lacticaseibacillus porcinae]